ncbi:Transmembrane protein [Hirschfeldia incana]|nr:Transmembrane protein [Hirschfeldia incana]
MDQPERRRPRPRPLETSGATVLATARVVYTRTKTSKNPASFLVQKLFQLLLFFSSMTSPFHRHLLAILSVADDHILAAQDTVETYFPSSTFAFLKISDILIASESLPEKLAGVLEKLPCLMSRTAWLDWMLLHAIYLLDSLVNVLGGWRDKNKGANEKEITVDRSFSRIGSNYVEDDEEKMRLGDEGKKVTYKEALQRGSSGEDGGGSTGRSSSSGDPIMEMFENGWITKPIKRRSSRSADSLTCSRSDSYETTT